MIKFITGITMLLFPIIVIAQSLNISGEVRPRFEYRDGYKTLGSKATDGAIFVSQRTRLNFSFQNKKEKIKFGMSLQNVRVWGDVNTLSSTDINGTALHQAWASVWLNDKFSLKAGRQEIIYDDHRIFGSVDWAQQARSHDALIAKFENGKHKFDVGLAFNANRETLFKEDYAVNNYKTFQYLWYNIKATDEIGISFLVLNNGVPFLNDEGNQKIAFSQTMGTRFAFSKDKLNADFAFYYQSGEMATTNLSAFYFAGNAKYKFHKDWAAKLGFEYLSGTDMNGSGTKLTSFSPLFGTNHKFNGFMDYFYVGNHEYSVGLVDIHASLHFNKKAFTIGVTPHLFLAPANLVDSLGTVMNSNLGTEIDLTLSYKISKSISVTSGYSKIFATNSMEILKGGSKDEANHWFWLSLNFKPNIFSYKKEE